MDREHLVFDGNNIGVDARGPYSVSLLALLVALPLVPIPVLDARLYKTARCAERTRIVRERNKQADLLAKQLWAAAKTEDFGLGATMAKQNFRYNTSEVVKVRWVPVTETLAWLQRHLPAESAASIEAYDWAALAEAVWTSWRKPYRAELIELETKKRKLQELLASAPEPGPPQAKRQRVE